MKMENPLRITSLNHVSFLCRSLDKSIAFYENVLGFVPIRRPGSFDFEGAWLFNFGFGIHLLQSDDPENMPPINPINPKDNHISFQCESMSMVEKRLSEMAIEFVKSRVEEGGIAVDQIFFHDPDGMMIEVCNCNVLPIIPIGSACSILSACSIGQVQPQQEAQLSSPRSCQQCTTGMSRLKTLPSMERASSVLSLAK